MNAARVLSIVKGTLLWMFLFSMLLVINVLQISSLVLLPFSRRLFRRVNRWCANTWWGSCVFGAHLANGFRLETSGDELPDEENAIIIVNHQEMPDITMLMDLALRKKRLGDLKFFVKDALRWMPGVGWGMHFLDFIFLARDWTKDKASVERTFRGLVQGKVPAWVVIFTEGTRLTPKKLQRSQEYARKQGLPQLRHLLQPRPKGFAAAVQGLRQHVTVVYDFTIGYVEGVPTLGQFITGATQKAYLHARRFPISDLPDDRDALADWLRERYKEKDNLLEQYYTQGSFISPGA